jgi:hexaprenyl-diphosphate synthase
LAEITEMIHTASLLHDDVIDQSMIRRSQPSANAEYGNKMAILAGDFLLARASLALARLRNPEVVELLATVISNLVEGEFMQLRNSPRGGSWFELRDREKEWNEKFDYYMKKTYMKTASLIAKSCEASTILSHCPKHITEAAFHYGHNLGLAFQVRILNMTLEIDNVLMGLLNNIMLL